MAAAYKNIKKRKSGWIAIIPAILISAFGAILLCLAIGVAWLSGNAGQKWITGQISSALSSGTNTTTIESLEGNTFGAFRLNNIRIEDQTGTWLTIEETAIDWRPLSLLRGEIYLHSLKLNNAVFSHMPLGEETNSAPTSQKKMPWVPARFYINSLDARIKTPFGANEDGALESYFLSAHSLTLSENMINLEAILEASREDADRLTLRVNWARDSGNLTLEATLKAQPGGILEAISGLHDHTPIGAVITGSGPIETWQGQANIESASGYGLQTHINGEGTASLSLDGSLFYNPFETQGIAALLGSEAQLSGTLEINDILRPDIDVLLRFPGAEASLTGQLNRTDSTFLGGLRSVITIPEATIPLSDDRSLDIQGFAGTVQFSNVSLTTTLDGTYRLDQIRVDQNRMEAVEGRYSLTLGLSPALHLTGSGQDLLVFPNDGTALESIGTQWELSANRQGQEGSQDFDITLHRLTLDWLDMSARATLTNAFQPIALSATGTLDDMALSTFLEIDGLSGQTRFYGTYEQREEDNTESVFLSAEAANFSLNKQVSDHFLGPAPTLQVSATRPVNSERVTLQATLEGQNITLQTNGSAETDGNLNLSYTTTLQQLSDFITPFTLEGPLDIQGQIEGPIENPAATANFEVDQVNLWGENIEALQAKISLNSLFQQPSGHFILEGQTAYGPAVLKSAAAFKDDTSMQLQEIEGALSGIALEGGITISPETMVLGTLRATFADQQIDLAGQGIQGNGNAVFDFSIADNNQMIAMQSGLQSLHIQDFSGRISTIESLNANGHITWADQPAGTLEITLEKFKRGSLHFDTASLAIDSGESTTITASGSGQYFQAFNFNLQNTAFEKREGGFHLPLHLEAMYGERPIRTDQPLDIIWSGEQKRIHVPSLVLGNGSLSGFFEISNTQIKINAEARQADMVLLTLPWAGVLSSGMLDGTFSMTRTAADLNLSANIKASRLASTAFLDQDDIPYTLSFEIQSIDDQFQGNGQIQQGEDVVGTLTTSFAYTLTPGFSLSDTAPFNLALDWHGPVEPVWYLASLNDHDLDGMLEGNIQVSGTLANPDFSGRARVSGGSYRYLPSGLELQDLSLNISGTEDTLTITSLDAKDTNGGNIHAEGGFDISPTMVFPGTLHVTANDLTFVDIESVTANGGGQLTYTRDQQSATLSGSINTNRIEAAISQQLPQSAVSIEVTEINRVDQGETNINGRRNLRRPPVNLDLSVNIPDRFFVRGRGLDSEWQGNLTLTGQSADPRVNGTLSLVRGQFSFAGKRFTLNSGQLYFDGSSGIDPEIDMVSRIETATIDAEIRVMGKLSSPQLVMSSVPALPEDEILSQILFGESITNLSAFQVAELASALATISGQGGGLNVLSTARETIGLDTLNFSSDTENGDGTLVTGGKYLTDNVYLELETATSTGETITRLFYDITRRLRAESEVGQKKGSSLKLKWFWDY